MFFFARFYAFLSKITTFSPFNFFQDYFQNTPNFVKNSVPKKYYFFIHSIFKFVAFSPNFKNSRVFFKKKTLAEKRRF